MQSLTAFCKHHKLAKTSVHRFLTDSGFDVSNGLSDDAKQAALTRFLPKFPVAPDNSSSMTIETGNHRGHLGLPQTPESLDLGAVRGDQSALSSFSPEDINRFLGACDGFIDAMDKDYQHQVALTRQKALAVQRVGAKVEQVKDAQREYKTRSEMLALHNQGLDTALQDGMNQLGKHAAGDGGA